MSDQPDESVNSGDTHTDSNSDEVEQTVVYINSEERLEEEEGDDLGDAPVYAAPISALPPRVLPQEESQIEVSASPAFQCLDDLFQEGKLTGTRVAALKAKYTQLHQELNNTRENERRLLQQAKQYSVELDKQKIELEKADNFPESSNTEVSKLRQQLLKHNNDLSQTEERHYQLVYKTECLQEEKQLMEKEYERKPKPGEWEKKQEELKNNCTELRKEITQRKQEIKIFKEDLEEKNRLIKKQMEENENIAEEVDKVKGELVAVNSIPGHISKEADKYWRQKNEVDKQMKDVNRQHHELTDELARLQLKFSQLEDEKFALDTSVDKQTDKLAERETEYQVLMKDFEYAKEREAVLMGDKATLDLNLRHVNLEKKNTHDTHSRKVREKDRDLRTLKKIELHLRIAQDNLAHTEMLHAKAKGNIDVLPKDDGSLLHKRQELHREVEQIKRALAQQNSLTAVETVKVEQSIAEEERLLYEQSDLRIEVVELTRLAAIKNDEREQKARDFMRAEMRYHRAVQDLKTKQLQIHDHQKKFNEMQVKLKEFAKLYDVIKNERNKCVNLIQTSTQKAAEMREKIKILQNEIEILRTAVAQKDRQLQKQRLKATNNIVMKDSLRNEVAKQKHIEDDMREKREQQRMDIAKLNLLINQSEEAMVHLRKRYETAVQHRNDRGIQLIERNEEVCIFYEKVNIQDQMIRNGDVELQGREEEIRFLNIQKGEDSRKVDLLRKAVPNKRNLEQELVTLQIQLSQCQDRMMDMEKTLENPNDPSRVRLLEGRDLTPAQMHSKLEELEERLAEKEEQMLEKDLIFEQVVRLSQRVQKKADSGKTDTLNLAKQVNELQAQIKDRTRKMMAMVSELTMHQAEAMKLAQQKKDMEGDLHQCYLNLEKGEPPSHEMEREWLRMIRDEHRRMTDKELARMAADEEEQYTLPGGIVTTAEPRPNAYIPEDDVELPIPRPYGSHAPYKPSEPGTTMRHIRKPVPKPIEI